MLKRTAYLLLSLALLIGMGLTARALAGDITGSMVYRWQGMKNMDQNSDLADAQSAGHMRSRLAFADDVDHTAAYNLTVENYQIFGDTAPDANSIYQATFTMRNFLAEGLDVTIGRRPVAYGRERVIGVENWDLATNILFEGVQGRYIFDRGWLDGFSYKLVETFGGKYITGVGDSNLMGLYLHYDATPEFFLEPYALATTTENWADPDISNDRLFTLGGLFDYFREGIHAYGEVVVQTGTSYVPAEVDQSGLGFYAGLFYDFDSEIEPYIGFEYDYASGDDAATADKNEAFSAPYGSISDFLGIMNVVNWSNVTALRFAGGFTPAGSLDVSADFFLFTLAQDNGGDDAIGNEIDVKLGYDLNADVDLEAGVGVFTYDEKSAMYVAPGDPRYFAWVGASLVF